MCDAYREAWNEVTSCCNFSLGLSNVDLIIHNGKFDAFWLCINFFIGVMKSTMLQWNQDYQKQQKEQCFISCLSSFPHLGWGWITFISFVPLLLIFVHLIKFYFLINWIAVVNIFLYWYSLFNFNVSNNSYFVMVHPHELDSQNFMCNDFTIWLKNSHGCRLSWVFVYIYI